MGRFQKTVLAASGIDQRQTGYYATPAFIADYLTRAMLTINPDGRSVFDPAVGQEELLQPFYAAGKQIDSIDLIDFGDYQYSRFQQMNFIDFYREATPPLDYDYFIANPPYNCHEISYIRQHKQALRALFPDTGTHNLYAMFLAGIIDLAKDGALIGMIIADSFLTAAAHAGLRHKIRQTCAIHHLILCPTDLFHDQKADVRTCLLILQKGREHQQMVRIGNRAGDKADFERRLQSGDFKQIPYHQLVLDQRQANSPFVVDVPPDILALFRHPRLGNLFDCITGISTGNDRRYLAAQPIPGYSYPFYKNPGRNKFYTEPNAYLIDDFLQEAGRVRKFTVRNRRFLFREGITCSSMGVPFSACYLPPGATFGVNANIFCPPEDRDWLLSYLNSSLVTYLVRGILLRSNMITSGYVSRIPVVPLDTHTKTRLATIAQRIIQQRIPQHELDSDIQAIDKLIFQSLAINPGSVAMIQDFAGNLMQRV